jgi:glycosyltransferase involved in cell wall biosynthesis
MRSQPKPSTIAAVIATHNRSGPLRRALASVMAQTRPPDEVIVVDDGSTDNTARWIPREFPAVAYIRQENSGVSAARNRGVASSRSEWIAFLDSDDEWRPTKLERQVEALANSPEYHICHNNEVWIRSGRRVNEGKRHAKSGGRIFQDCLPLCVISPSAAVIRRSILQRLGGFDESLPVCEDYDLWLRICARYPVLFLEEALTVKHGGHGDQLSRRYWGMDRFRIRAIDKILSEDVLSPADRDVAVRVILEKIGVYVDGARKRGKDAEVAAYEAIRRKYKRPGTRAPRPQRT